MLGHLDAGAARGQAPFFAGLGLVAIGSGLLKANISTMVGHLYDGPDDPRRDGGFTIFYMGINLGAFAAPLVIGTVGEKVNWHLGFALAARRHGAGPRPVPARHPPPERRAATSSPRRCRPRRSAPTLRKAAIWAGRRRRLLRRRRLHRPLHAELGAGPDHPRRSDHPGRACCVRIKRDKDLTRAEQSKMTGYIWFFVAAAVFWMIYDQGGSTLSIFADSKTAGTPSSASDFPVSWYQSVNPVLIMALAPVFAWLWLWLNRRGKEPSTIVKFAIGPGPGRRVVLRLPGPADDGRRTAPRSARCGWSAIYFDPDRR